MSPVRLDYEKVRMPIKLVEITTLTGRAASVTFESNGQTRVHSEHGTVCFKIEKRDMLELGEALVEMGRR